jgi:hypothetical protein
MTRTTQPEGITSQEIPRAPDEHVVTTDSIADPLGSKGDAEAKPPAPAAAPQGDANSPDSATGTADNQATDRQRKRSNASRLRKLADKLSAAEAREASQAQRIRDLEDQVTSIKEATPKPKEPMLQDFKSPAEYARAYAKWESSTKARPAPAPRATPAPAVAPPQAPSQEQAPAQPSKELADFHQRGKAKLGDQFVEALTEKTWVNQMAAEYILDSDFGPEIYVHLANHLDEAKTIFDYSPVRANKALAALEAKAKAGTLDLDDGDEPDDKDQGKEEAAPKGQARTKAPPPPNDIRPAGSSPSPDPNSESMDDYANRRRKEELRRRGLIV